MTNITKSLIPKCLICLILFLLLAQVYALPTAELIFVHPKRSKEIWISNTLGINARKLFRQTFERIDKIEVQEDGRYVLAVASIAISEEQIGVVRFVQTRTEVFLLDMRNPNRKAKDLTLDRFWSIFDADISSKGDVVIVATPGLLLIKHEQLNEPEPEFEILLDLDDWDINNIQWSPDGEKIAFNVRENLYLYDVESRDIFRIAFNVRYGTFAFSPDGTKIAFNRFIVKDGERWGTGILVTPVEPNADVEIIHLDKDFSYGVQAWSPDGKYITYASYTDPDNIKNIEQFRLIRNHIIPATGGESEQILIGIKETVESLGWVHQTYPVEPGNSLVTTWGKLKSR